MAQKRGVLARTGVALLNLLVPGLGLLRIGRWKFAAAAYSATIAFLVFVYSAPQVGFAVFAAVLVAGLAAYPVSIGATWILGRTVDHPRQWYAQWYSIVGAVLFALAMSYFLPDEGHARYRSFFTPAEGMAPTLVKGDRFVAYMKSPSELRRGDILLVRAPDGSTYVKRLAGLPGDEIAVTKGIVTLNGEPAALQLVGNETLVNFDAASRARRLRERLPGESGWHQIYDDGVSPGDNFGPQRVRPGHIFLLGDNRDHSADSRYSQQESGLEQLPINQILGWPLFHSFGSSRPLGEQIDRENMQ